MLEESRFKCHCSVFATRATHLEGLLVLIQSRNMHMIICSLLLLWVIVTGNVCNFKGRSGTTKSVIVGKLLQLMAHFPLVIQFRQKKKSSCLEAVSEAAEVVFRGLVRGQVLRILSHSVRGSRHAAAQLHQDALTLFQVMSHLEHFTCFGFSITQISSKRTISFLWRDFCLITTFGGNRSQERSADLGIAVASLLCRVEHIY